MVRIWLTLALVLSVLLTAGYAAADDSKDRNVLIFFMDDLRPELGCYGEQYIRSPNIDGLASAGVIFDRAYCQQALCGPSRISMMSGMYPNTTGITDLWTPLTKAFPNAMSLPRYFKERGYETCSYGKVYHHSRDDTKSWSDHIPKSDIKYANPETLDGIEQRVREGRKNGVSVEELRILGNGPATEIGKE